MTQVELPSPLNCYSQVYALDIENDGSVGSLQVPGLLELAGLNTVELCLPIKTVPPQGIL